MVSKHGGERGDGTLCVNERRSAVLTHAGVCVCVSGWRRSGAESGDAPAPDGGDAHQAAAADGGGPEMAGAGGELPGTDTTSLSVSPCFSAFTE